MGEWSEFRRGQSGKIIFCSFDYVARYKHAFSNELAAILQEFDDIFLQRCGILRGSRIGIAEKSEHGVAGFLHYKMLAEILEFDYIAGGGQHIAQLAVQQPAFA